MARVKLQSPWIQYYEKISLLFGCDPEIRVLFDEENLEIKLYVSDSTKADALTQLLPTKKTWGNITLKLTIVPPNDSVSVVETKSIIAALNNNPIVDDIVLISGIMTNDITYILFKKEVVQYFIDDLGDAHGNCSTLWQEIAKEVFGNIPGVFFCTSEDEPIFETCPNWP